MAVKYKTEPLVNGLMTTGCQPPGLLLGSAPLLDDWGYTINETNGAIRLSGRVTWHPSLPDGDLITSSLVRYIDPAFGFVLTSNRTYRLGAWRPRG